MSKHRRLTGYEFDYDAVRKAIRVWEMDLDIIINMLPEYTASLSQFFCRSLDRKLGPINVPIISFYNWPHSWETKHQQVVDSRVGFRQLEGHFFSEETWTYSDVAKDLVEKIQNRFMPHLNKPIYKVHYGIDVEEYKAFDKNYGKTSAEDGKIRFLFNHRNGRYCGIDRLQDFVKRLSTIRQDFKIVLKNPSWLDEVDRNKNMDAFLKKYGDFIEISPNVDKFKEEYYRDMARCDIAMCAHVYLPWNLSCQEAALFGLPILGPKNTALDEILYPEYPYLYKNTAEMVKIADAMITDIKAGKDLVNARIPVMRWDWTNIIPIWIGRIEELVSKYRNQDYDGEKRNQIPIILKEYGKRFTKKDLKDKIKYTKPDGKQYTILPGMEETNWTRQRHVLLKFGFKDDCKESQPTFYHPDWNKDENSSSKSS
jgi:hypothetical protein